MNLNEVAASNQISEQAAPALTGATVASKKSDPLRAASQIQRALSGLSKAQQISVLTFVTGCVRDSDSIDRFFEI